jgi:MFS family permease
MKRLQPKATTLVLLMLCLMYFITYVDRVNISTAAGQFKSELGLSNTQLGFIFSAFAYPYVLFQFIGGWVSDRFGAKRTLIFCALIWAVATTLTGLAGGFATLVAARLLLGLGEGATFPASTSAMASWVRKDKRGMAQGITHSSARLGNAVAPMLVLALMTAFNWRFSFYLLGALSLGWLVLWYVTYTEKPADHPRITPEEISSLPPPTVRPVEMPGTWMRLYRRLLPVSGVYFCYNWILWLMLDWMPLYFMHSFHLNIKKAVIFTSGVFVAGVFNEMNIGPMWAIPMDMAYDRSGTASGIMSGTGFTAAIVSPVVAGYLIDRLGNWNVTFLLSIGVMACGVLMTFIMKPDAPFVVKLKHAMSSEHTSRDTAFPLADKN